MTANHARSIALAFAVSASLAAAPAFAHAFLERANPPVGCTAATSPADVMLYFTEPVVPQFSSVRVLDSKGKAVGASKPRRAADNERELLVGLPKLPSGTYTVIWHVTSEDTHKTEGRFSFKIGP